MTPPAREPKSCWRCGSEFGCGARGEHPCWCAALPPLPVLDRAQDCLCPACLAHARPPRDCPESPAPDAHRPA